MKKATSFFSAKEISELFYLTTGQVLFPEVEMNNLESLEQLMESKLNEGFSITTRP